MYCNMYCKRCNSNNFLENSPYTLCGNCKYLDMPNIKVPFIVQIVWYSFDLNYHHMWDYMRKIHEKKK